MDIRIEMLKFLIGEIEVEQENVIQRKTAIDRAKVKCDEWNAEHKDEKPKFWWQFAAEENCCEAKKSRIKDNAKLARRLLLELSKEV